MAGSIQLLLLASIRGLIVRGPLVGREHVLNPFGRIAPKDDKALAADAEDVMSYLADVRDRP